MKNSKNQICPLCSGPGRFFYADERRSWTYYRCQNCELIWKDPADCPSSDEELAHYGTHQNDPDDANYRAFLNRLWEPLKTRLAPEAIGLDYGSGPGPTLHLMAQEDGFDCEHYDPFFHPDASTLEKKYDFITCSETAEHFHRPAKEFKRLARLLKSDGLLGVMTSTWDESICFSNWRYRLDPTHVVFYCLESFKYIAENSGFKGMKSISKNVVVFTR